ncbi:hypothetical protein C4D60_Mb09t05030 [Musa balbisiana]|uniref:Phytocyanin domain-containing protein n=1 Tax=Musa balbisiana TaxID=52838 RepID=A0A4V4H314_MUSBA|nr:hypothetical protein C4D60_Mb09t05030 [Musa balbisiana]
MEASKGLAALLLVAGVTMALMDSAGAYVFYAGGRDGWVLHPSESYGDWAERNRFQVADTIVFKYKKGEGSVLVVSKQDYDACDVSKPIRKLDGGDSVFKFDRSGPFYFISGAPGNCQQGQKLVVVVMAVRNCPPISSPPSLPPSPPPTSNMPPASSPSPAPVSHGPAPPPFPEPHPPTPAPSAAPVPGSPPPPKSSGGAVFGPGISPAPAPFEPASSSSSSSSYASNWSLVTVLLLIVLGASSAA